MAKGIKLLRFLAKLQQHVANAQYVMFKIQLNDEVVQELELGSDFVGNDEYPIGIVVDVVHLNTVYQQFYSSWHQRLS